ncbi:MAG: hypothetical protein ACYTEP_02130 [Planctomycetota bacterium]|jgi:hypothetical protein
MILLAPLLLLAAAQEPPAAPPEARIQWFGTLEQGLAEAQRTGRPLMMTAAAPQCRGVSGKW